MCFACPVEHVDSSYECYSVEMSSLEKIMTGTNQLSKEAHFPGEEGIWVFVMGDLAVFTLFFCVFLIHRHDNIEIFFQSRQQLNLHFGMLNTVLLLVSSWLVAVSVQAFRQGDITICKHSMGLASLCGLLFIVAKYFEWGAKFDIGLMPETNDFFMFYYIFTGIHLVHLLVGVGILLYLWVNLHFSAHGGLDSMAMESSATYWHMVDVIWIILFPLLYLL